MVYKHKAPGDKPESTERQADIAELEFGYKFRISEHRQNQVRIRCLNAGGMINTRVGKYG
jgi:hypothetical protein